MARACRMDSKRVLRRWKKRRNGIGKLSKYGNWDYWVEPKWLICCLNRTLSKRGPIWDRVSFILRSRQFWKRHRRTILLPSALLWGRNMDRFMCENPSWKRFIHNSPRLQLCLAGFIHKMILNCIKRSWKIWNCVFDKNCMQEFKI